MACSVRGQLQGANMACLGGEKAMGGNFVSGAILVVVVIVPPLGMRDNY